MVRVLADEVLQYTTNPSKKIVRIVAQESITKFAVLEDKMDGVKLGNGYDSLAYQIYTRIENMRRKKKQMLGTSSAASSTDEDGNVAKRQRRNTVIDSYGCVQWEPDFPLNETAESLLNKKQLLKEARTFDEIKSLIKDTYYMQRHDINTGTRMESLLNQWPALFTEVGLFEHFQILTNIDIIEELEKNVSLKGKDILSFLSSCDKRAPRSFLYELHEEDENELLLIVLGTTKYFEEDNSFLMTLSPPNLDVQNMMTYAPTHPVVIGRGSSYFASEEYVLMIDGIVVNSEIRNPAIAVAMLFSSYFVFNIKYTPEIQLTLEFIQRCLVGINPLSGTKYRKQASGRTYQGVHPKIQKYINKIKNCKNWLIDARQ